MEPCIWCKSQQMTPEHVKNKHPSCWYEYCTTINQRVGLLLTDMLEVYGNPDTVPNTRIRKGLYGERWNSYNFGQYIDKTEIVQIRRQFNPDTAVAFYTLQVYIKQPITHPLHIIETYQQHITIKPTAHPVWQTCLELTSTDAVMLKAVYKTRANFLHFATMPYNRNRPTTAEHAAFNQMCQ